MTPVIFVAIIVMFAHWIADFVLQNDKIATNKHHDNYALFNHIWRYFFAMSLMLVVPCLFLLGMSVADFVFVMVFNSVAHYVIDYITSRVNAIFHEIGERHKFFVSIGFDQFIHLALLFATIFARF